MKTFSQFICDIQERYYAPDEKLPGSGKTPYGKSRSSYFRNKRKYNDSSEHEERMRHLGRSLKQITRSNDKVRHGADNPNFNSSSHPDAEVSTDRDKSLRVRSKGINYLVKNTGNKTKDGKPVHDIMWYSVRDKSTDANKKQIARDAKNVWDTHVQHRLPHGSVLTNFPLSNPTDENPEKNTRSKLYQRAGFGPVGLSGDQYASVGREPSPKQKAKGKKRLKPMSGDTKTGTGPDYGNEWED
jgi:hypothetical protein